MEEAAPAEPAAEEAAPAVPAEDVADPADAFTNPEILTTEVKTKPARKKAKLKSAQIALELPIRVRGFFE